MERAELVAEPFLPTVEERRRTRVGHVIAVSVAARRCAGVTPRTLLQPREARRVVSAGSSRCRRAASTGRPIFIVVLLAATVNIRLATLLPWIQERAAVREACVPQCGPAPPAHFPTLTSPPAHLQVGAAKARGGDAADSLAAHRVEGRRGPAAAHHRLDLPRTAACSRATTPPPPPPPTTRRAAARWARRSPCSSRVGPLVRADDAQAASRSSTRATRRFGGGRRSRRRGEIRRR